MRHEHFRPGLRLNEPVPSDGDAVHHGRFSTLAFLPSLKIHGAGKRSKHYELGKGNACSLRQRGRRVERIPVVGRKTKDKRSQHMNTMLAKFLQLLDEP